MPRSAGIAMIGALVTLGSASGQDRPAGARPPGARYTAPAFTFHPIKAGVYLAVGTGNLGVGSNAAVFVNERDVMLVDSHVSPAAAWALLRELRQVTPKPVRHVVNTHFHYDHVHGNQAYGPEVEIIGHEFTREMVRAGKSKDNVAFTGSVRFAQAQLDNLTKAADSATDPARKADLRRQAEVWRQQQVAVAAVTPVPPNLTLSQRMTLIKGGREIEILFLGRGHTGGDVVVYLPAERVLATGDLLVQQAPFLGDGHLREWAATLEELKRLDFEVVLPGHGEAFSDRAAIDHLQAYLLDFWNQTEALHRAGVSAEDAAARLDLTPHLTHYPIPATWTPEIVARQRLVGVRRVYELLSPAR
jgi:glyoxylase-like metal-dependent hydrolase (beta-lactamase superfamily II)